MSPVTKIKRKPPVDYASIAQAVMFGGQLDLQRHGVVYRSGKTVEDVRAALKKARDPKVGHAKTEFELSMFEVYLKGLLKAAPAGPSPVAA
jgi:hypothetical protein